MTLLRAFSKEEREQMTADDLFESIVQSIQKADGSISIRTRYESADKTKDLWLNITPHLIDKARSDILAGEASPDGVVH